MLYKSFKSAYNSIWNPKKYNHYVGKKYSYGDTIITITGIYTGIDGGQYFETSETNRPYKICRHILSFLEDVKNGVYKEVHHAN